MAKNSYKTAVEAINWAQNIFIFHHIRPDGDCLGSQRGLAELIKTNLPQKNVYVIGDNKNLFPFMNFKYDDINNVPKEHFNNSLAIVVDANSSNRIQNVELILNNTFTKTLRIDHHPVEPDINYDWTWEDAEYAASGEQIAYIAMKENWKVTDEAAKYCYLAINTDSSRFQYDSVAQRTFDVTSYLHTNNNFKVWDVNFPLSIRDERKVRFMAYVLLKFKFTNQISYFHVTKKIQKKFNLNEDEANDVNILANIGDTKIWVFFIDTENGDIRVRIRSNGIWINHIAKKWRGGGHELASGAMLKSKSEIKLILNDLKEEIIKNANK
ncbi:DHH family phosphoesterase [Mycoplasma miroungirhinis]|uniref:Bifunctional oligoribonuclease/PAP phosphatase NrnA n=1 Tax=Mycoplasma miroungirhinis TaxID=754516 RepID=A0A6M4JH15_9MOLU|nr:bifunctional oligoribonuclease/PAP phosphatase NrnA [Mycoplasma miroungirhinis]QJR44312.1 bifunctional oligoribonuclease/PAP phosphatase NrnA [Mycoplasma miroungirhinis]